MACFQPALCKETKVIWKKFGWKFSGCNCTRNKMTDRERKDEIGKWSEDKLEILVIS
jgi:hypothetical protein